MIVLVSGTNGAGKTHLVRRILDLLPRGDPVAAPAKVVASRHGDVVVIGRYDGPACGGCDAFSWKGAADDIEAVAVGAVSAGAKVLLEGVIVSTWGRDRLLRLASLGLVVVHLTTPLETCIDSVNDRRRVVAASKGKEFVPVKTDNISAKYHGLSRKKDPGIEVLELDREVAFVRVRELLGLS